MIGAECAIIFLFFNSAVIVVAAAAARARDGAAPRSDFGRSCARGKEDTGKLSTSAGRQTDMLRAHFVF
jgi:hypothetical protein